jgi:FkbM family methyltransferase
MELPGALDIREHYGEEASVRDLYWQPQAGDVCVDIGCLIGSYTLPALAAGARVVAVDPDKASTDVLEEIAALNKFTDYTVINAAVFDGSSGYDAEVGASLLASVHGHMAPPAGTRFTTLDDLVADLGLPRVDWLKIDVEGAELGVLRGGRATLRQYQPRLVIEDHTAVYPFVAEMQSTRQCLELLGKLGYVGIVEVPYRPQRGCEVFRTYLVTP